MTTDAQKAITKETVQFGGIPRRPAGMKIDGPTRDLERNLLDQVDRASSGTREYEGAVYALHQLYGELEAQVAPSDEWGTTKWRVEDTDPDTGRPRIREWDDRGNQREVPIDHEAAEQQVAQMKLRTDERASIKTDLSEVVRLQELISTITDPVAQEQLRARATELHDAAMARLEKLREAVPNSEWPEYDLGQGPALSTEETEAIQLARDGNIDTLAGVWRDLKPEQQQAVLHAVPPEQTGWLSKLIETAEREEGEA